MSIKSDLDYLEQTKGLIKEAIINKGQDIEDNTPFREYVDKIDSIETEPTKPMGIKVYKRAEILDDQTDLVNYYAQGAQTGELMNLNCYQIRFSNMNNNVGIPQEHILSIVFTNPGLMMIETLYLGGDNLIKSKMYYFNPTYTQIFIQIANQLGLYDAYVQSFLSSYGITESELLLFNGWYIVSNNTLASTSHPVFEHTRLHWILKATVQQGLTDNYDMTNAFDYIDMDKTNLNITLVDEEDVWDCFDVGRQLSGRFLSDSNAEADDIVTNKVAYTKSGKVIGTLSVLGDVSKGGVHTTVTNLPNQNKLEVTSPITSGSERYYVEDGSYIHVGTPYNKIVNAIGLQANQIKQGDTVLGVTGTYKGTDTSDATATSNEILKNKTAYVNGTKLTGEYNDTYIKYDGYGYDDQEQQDIPCSIYINFNEITNETARTNAINAYNDFEASSSFKEAYGELVNKLINISTQDAIDGAESLDGDMYNICFYGIYNALHPYFNNIQIKIKSEENNVIYFNNVYEEAEDVGGTQMLCNHYDFTVLHHTNTNSDIGFNIIIYTGINEETGDTEIIVKSLKPILVASDQLINTYTSVADMNADIDNIEEGDIAKVVESNVTTFYIKEMETTYQPLDFSQLNIGDTISLKGMKINNTATSNLMTASGDSAQFILSNNNETILQIDFGASVRSISGSITINNSSYNYTSVAEGEISELSAADVETINSSNIWSSDTLLTIENNGKTTGNNYIENAILQPVQQGVMKKLIKEEDTLPVDEYVEATNISDDILGEETE